MGLAAAMVLTTACGGAAQGELADVLRDVLRVIAGTRTEDDATTHEDRGALVAVTGVTGALLLVDLLVVAADYTPLYAQAHKTVRS